MGATRTRRPEGDAVLQGREVRRECGRREGDVLRIEIAGMIPKNVAERTAERCFSGDTSDTVFDEI